MVNVEKQTSFHSVMMMSITLKIGNGLHRLTHKLDVKIGAKPTISVPPSNITGMTQVLLTTVTFGQKMDILVLVIGQVNHGAS